MSIKPEVPDCLRLLRTYTHIAIVGFSADPRRPSHFVAAYLLAEGYSLVLVNPRYAGQSILGRRVYASLVEARAAGEQIEIVDVFRKAQDLEPVLQEASAIGARVLWLQLGIRSEEIGRRAEAAGMECVQDSCIKTWHTIAMQPGTPLSRG
ncbi:MAG TPA: CoA-binding protein [Ktedonobacteraceae bacterium]|jgi:predicted CoA-binding protein